MTQVENYYILYLEFMRHYEEGKYIVVSMKDFIKAMKALSDPNRVKIVKLLQCKSMCVCEIQEALQASQPTVSKNLKILQDAGIVDNHKDGLWVNYYISDVGNSPYISSLLGNLKHWLENDPEIAQIKKRLPYIRREDINRR